MQIIEDRIKTYITTLSLLSSLNIEDFDNEDDITMYIPNCITNTVLILGNVFDEELTIFIKEANRLISELYRKDIREVDIANIFGNKKLINKIINENMYLILNTDSYEYSYQDIENVLNDKINKYFDSLNLQYITVNRNIIEDVINHIIYLIDTTYKLSKDLSTSIIEKINYIYNYKDANLSDISFYAIDGILYLVKYYIVTFKIFNSILILFNENKNLNIRND